MAELKDFLSELAINPQKLGEFIHDPEAAMTAAELTNEDKAALRSGFPGIIYARLAGIPTKEAFQIASRPPDSTQQNVSFSQFLPNYPPQIWPQVWPPPQIWPQIHPPPQIWPQVWPPPQIWPQVWPPQPGG